jgi:hypothetical protein
MMRISESEINFIKVESCTMNIVSKFHIPQMCFWDEEYVSFRTCLNYVFEIRLFCLCWSKWSLLVDKSPDVGSTGL